MAENTENCTPTDCDSCKLDCDSRKTNFLEEPNKNSNIKKVIGIVSGKGGVGKSLVTSLLGVYLNRMGGNVAIMDADITGPSIPRSFGVTKKATGNENEIFPVETSEGIKTMSINLLLEEETKPVVWRGSVIAGTIHQFWKDVTWGEVDYMLVDMPPGTGDVPLTVFQSIPLDGIIIVTSPQDLVSMVVKKAINMAKMMNIKVLGIVENMSYVQCDNCDNKMYVFGESKLEEVAKDEGIQILDKIPLTETITKLVNKGRIEDVEDNYLKKSIDEITKV